MWMPGPLAVYAEIKEKFFNLFSQYLISSITLNYSFMMVPESIWFSSKSAGVIALKSIDVVAFTKVKIQMDGE